MSTPSPVRPLGASLPFPRASLGSRGDDSMMCCFAAVGWGHTADVLSQVVFLCIWGVFIVLQNDSS